MVDVYNFLQAFMEKLIEWVTPWGVEVETACNEILEEENAGHRLQFGLVIPHISEIEYHAVVEALDKTSRMEPVRQHLRDAIAHLNENSERKFNDSIADSMHAVIAMVGIIIGDTKKDARPALNEVQKLLGIHTQETQAFINLYRWTSDDKSGIRHPMADSSQLFREDATYVLAVCSAFISFLIEKCRRKGIVIRES
jgi:hypothetical protein